MTNSTSVKNAADPHELLREKFGWSEFKMGQLEVIQRLLDGKSVLSVFPTGGGKSLCYQLPALAFDGLTVIVSPLIALMKDQIDQLQNRGVLAVRLDSSLSGEEYRQAMDSIRSGTTKMLYVAPERFFNERFRSSLEGVQISLFAIDEAHCISQWGHNFRPDYLKLASIAEQLKVERVLALTATATPTVQADICLAFEIDTNDVICTEFFRPNLHIRSCIVDEAARTSKLLSRLKSEDSGASIVYVTLQKTAEQVAETCANAGLCAKPYHAGMQTEQRNEIQEWFMNGEANIVVATIAFGMGIDKSDIRAVYHYNPPKSIESYAQEIGRAGRDGKIARCEMLLVPEDRITLENFVYGDTPSASAVQSLISEIARQEPEFFVSQIKLANLCDMKSLVAKTLLTYLELDGYLESTSPRYNAYSFKPNVASSVILENFSGERLEFAKRLLACSRKNKVWFTIDLDDAMKKLDSERIRIVKALDYFNERGWIELRAADLVHGYRKLKAINSVAALAEHYTSKIDQREKSEIDRIDQVLELASPNRCQSRMLSNHFGQPMDADCGTCSFCLGEGPFELPSTKHNELSTTRLEQITKVVSDHPAALDSPRSVARFLCGLTSPALTRSKLSRHELFGSSREFRFDQIMKQVEAIVGQSEQVTPTLEG